jgi:acyl-coenzyme A thioesterase PaaI-like protein
MAKSLRTRLFRVFFNFFPCYRRTGARITYIARDWSEIRLRLPLNWTTRNYVGTIFGGSMYGAVDPVYMLMLIRRLGRDYIVWDKAATIQFIKPGRSTLYAHFRIDDVELAEIHALLQTEPSITRDYQIELVDSEGIVHAVIDKNIYIRPKHTQAAPASPRAEAQTSLQ